MWDTEFLAILKDALSSITEPRLFKTERGYQGELIAALKNRLVVAEFPGDPIVEQEYQKRIPHHGLNIRPDIIVHIPFDRGTMEQRSEGNFVAIELKLRAGKTAAQGAFESLRRMKEGLDYPLTIFINVDSSNLFTELCPAQIAAQTVCFAVTLENAKPVVVNAPPL
jgi:hypothetical protein